MRQAILREDMSCVNWGNRSSKDFPCGYPVPMEMHALSLGFLAPNSKDYERK